MLLKKSKTKKGVAFDVIRWIWRFIFLVIVLGLIVSLVAIYNVGYKQNQIEVELFYYSLFTSKNGISYYDSDVDRLYPYVLDYDKLNQEYFDELLSNNFFYGEKNEVIGVKLECKIKMDARTETKIMFYNPDYYKKLEPIANIKGPGGSTKFTSTLNSAAVRKDGNIYNSICDYTLLIQNED